jgi:hypothetical protein
LIAVGVWIALCVVVSARPIVDTVPTGRVGEEFTSQEVRCHSALSGSDEPTQDLPTLPAPRAYERTPCDVPHGQARLLLWGDVVLGLLAAAALARTAASHRRRRHQGSAAQPA